MGWYDSVKSYVWDDRTTPYFIKVEQLSRPQVRKELLLYCIFLVFVFSAGAIAAVALAKSRQAPLFYLAAVHAVSIVWCAIYLGFTKHPVAARYAMTAPLMALVGFATGVLNPRLQTIEFVGMLAFCLGWLWYSQRVVLMARAYSRLSETLPEDLPPLPPTMRRRQG